MTGIIKSDIASGRVRPALLSTPMLKRNIAAIVTESELDQLREKQASHDAELNRLRAEIETARRNGEAEGRKSGLAEGRQDAKQTLEAFKAGMSNARELWAVELKDLERLAAALASAAIERVLGPKANQKSLVTQIIGRQISALDAQTSILIEVSAQDFPDQSTLKPLQDALGTSRIEIRNGAALRSGDCRFSLRLGSLEVGPTQQWAALATTLAEMAAPTAKP